MYKQSMSGARTRKYSIKFALEPLNYFLVVSMGDLVFPIGDKSTCNKHFFQEKKKKTFFRII